MQTQFNYAWVSTPPFEQVKTLQQLNLVIPQGLIKSATRPEQERGVQLLTSIFRESPPRRRECLYYLALGNYKLGNFQEARRYNELLLEKEPSNMQAGSLRSLIDDKVQREGLVGAAIIGSAAVILGVLGGVLVKGLNRSR